MLNCPICRARLNGASTCRRCRAELDAVLAVEQQGRALADTAMHHIALGDLAGAAQLLRRARTVHATAEVRWLAALVETETLAEEQIDAEDSSPDGAPA
jgi:predicted amidophosphoribosyltransferase